jgi:tartrate dehydratase beta subunit/fumarate hydratase class I family protein
MNAKQVRSGPMTADQLEDVKKEIIQIYLFLISKSEHNPMVVELMKLSALADAQKRYETEEPWLTEN